MTKVNVTFLLNKEDKDKMDQLLSQLGMTFSGALNMFVKQSVREQALPLNLSLKTSGSNLLDDINGNANISKPYDNVRDLFEDLLNE
ncbi:MAG: type II toxin-antitoxin system RelB/DinJ family antitoxin [Peptoniphilus harei]|nr:type II toxin-antitoxin system RelB/DinJ family antitoxin [Peptoniphilus harei]